MTDKTTKLFSSELNKHLYPILADDYFNTTRIGEVSLIMNLYVPFFLKTNGKLF